MERSVWRQLVVAVVGLTGCGTGAAVPLPTTGAQSPYEAQGEPRRVEAAKAEVSWDTERDQTFARFLQEKSGGMVRKAAVGLEKQGMLNVEISPAVAPDDTLPLTRSLMAGARKDFPDQPITIAVFDPQGEPILKARYRPGEGVNYQIAHDPAGHAARSSSKDNTKKSDSDPLTRGGVTARDQKFAAWAEGEARPLLRYVEADLERHGRLWFGITREVKPKDVKPLARSLLLGARKEFPGGELVATVFDPEGERIGRARLERDGEVQWEK